MKIISFFVYLCLFSAYISITIKTNTMKTRCEKCNKELAKDRIVWLELSNTDGRYYLEIPDGHTSQGGFPFGSDCATSEIRK